jgi:acetyltransferase-like isoleucine patch superfamily enzyme
MRLASVGVFKPVSTRLACWLAPPFYGRIFLATFSAEGFISPSATVWHQEVETDRGVYIDDRVLVYQDEGGGPVRFEKGVQIFRDSIIQTGLGGRVRIGSRTTVQPRCQFSAYISPIDIGEDVQIAPNCAFYSYDHSFSPGELIKKQPLQTKGGIFVEDDVWLGIGCIILDGVRIGRGAVIGAGSVVTVDIGEGAIAVGAPARVVKRRDDLA